MTPSRPPRTRHPVERRRRRHLVAVLGLLAAAVILRAAATGDLAPPPLSIDGAAEWLRVRSAAVTVVALVRLVAEATVLYLFGVSCLHLIGRLAHAAWATSTAEVLTAPGLRHAVHAVVGIGLLGAGGGSSDPVAPAPPDRPTLEGTFRLVAATTEAPTEATLDPTVGLADDGPGGRATMTPVAPTTDAAAAESPDPAGATPLPWPSTWTVAPEESFWTIAADLVDEHGPTVDPSLDGVHLGPAHRPPSVHAVWERLVEANRDRLVDPDDPDLLLPGQVLEVPTPGGADAATTVTG